MAHAHGWHGRAAMDVPLPQACSRPETTSGPALLARQRQLDRFGGSPYSLLTRFHHSLPSTSNPYLRGRGMISGLLRYPCHG